MRDIKRIHRILDLIESIWRLPMCQDMRFWQFLSFLDKIINVPTDKFYIEDDITEKMLEAIYEKLWRVDYD